jgi:PqqD family protein of HPr-rel-A system
VGGTVTAPQRPMVREGLTVIELDGEAVVYDEQSGNLHHLNQTAALVFSLCDGTGTARELSSDIAQAYGLGVDQIAPQVRSLLRTLKREGLVTSHA